MRTEHVFPLLDNDDSSRFLIVCVGQMTALGNRTVACAVVADVIRRLVVKPCVGS